MDYFKNDLALGNKAELLVCKMVRVKYPKTYKVEGYCKEWDLVVPEINKTIEVKFDREAQQTPNYFFETEYDGEPSGIIATKADYWAHLDGSNIIWCDTEALRWFLKENSFDLLYGGSRGSKPKRGYVIRQDLIRDSIYFKTVHFKF